MAKCKTKQLEFASCQNLKVQADFHGGEVSSDGGLLLIREVEKRLNLLKRASEILPDPRNPELITHTRYSQICQRVFALVQGYEDLNDHQSLRNDTLLQTVTGQKDVLSSPSTLCRMEAQGNRHCAKALNELLVEVFVESYSQAPEELILDFDATDDPVHGQQEGSFFHGYYGHYCKYVVGFARNARTKAENQDLLEKAETRYQATGEKQRHLRAGRYQAKSWDRPRNLITKVEHNEHGPNLRHVLSNLEGTPEEIYDEIYCARGDMENRIKEQQMGLFADRTSCQRWWPNQLRLLESTLAYVLVDGLRRLGLEGTDWASKQVTTLRCQLLKVGAVLIRNTRRVLVHLSSSWPGEEIYRHAHQRLRQSSG